MFSVVKSEAVFLVMLGARSQLETNFSVVFPYTSCLAGSVTRWFEQKSTQYLSKNAQFGAQSKTPKKVKITTDLNKSED